MKKIKMIMILTMILVLIVILLVIFCVIKLNTKIVREEQSLIIEIEDEKKAVEDNVLNILFLGLDRTEERDKKLGVYRTDTIALVSIHMDTKETKILRIPRDTYVFIPCINKKDKINHAYVWGGMNEEGISSTIDTVNKFIKYDTIDYYVAIDMEPIPNLVDRIGGVEVDVETEMEDKNVKLSKGRQILSGKEALTYISWRKTGNGDIDRIKRQQKFLISVLSQLKDPSQITTLINLRMEYEKYIKTDIKLNQMVSFATLLKDIQKNNIKFYTVNGVPNYLHGVSYWIPNDEKNEILFKQIFEIP